MQRTPEQDLLRLRKQAEAHAEQRAERPSTAHLLWVVSEEPGLARALLEERRIDARAIGGALRVVTDDDGDAVTKAVTRARDFAGRQLRGGAREGAEASLHLLHALCQEPKSASYRFLQQVGVDIGRLRATIVQYATGATAPRRAVAVAAPAPVAAAPSPYSARPSVRPSSPPPRPLSAPPPLAPAPSPASPSAKGRQLPLPASPRPKAALRPKARAPQADPPVTAPPTAAPQTPAAQTLAGPPPSSTSAPAAGKGRKRFPRLAAFAQEPTGEAPLCLGRSRELGRLVELLHKRQGHHALVVGDPSVGRSTLLRALAAGLASAGGDRPFRPLPVDVAALLAAAPGRGQLTTLLRELDDEARAFAEESAASVVLLLDDAAPLFAAEAEAETAAALRRITARAADEGRPTVGWVLALTTAEAKRVGDRDGGLLRNFGLVEVPELSVSDAQEAARALVAPLGRHHGVRYEEGVIDDAVRWTARWAPERRNPEKSLVLLDRAGARSRLLGATTVTREVVAKVLAEEARVPAERLLESDGERLLALEKHVGAILVGHEAPVAKMADLLRRNASGFRSGRPIGSFLLLGPTGVGKTECAKAIAAVVFGAEQAMTRIDLSEYAEPHSVARLIGSPPGYVGHEAGGQLTEAVARRPYQLLLLDEVEKAHRDVLLTFLQVFDEGHLTDGRGRRVDFSNTVIVLTSNLGAEHYQRKAKARVGFGAGVEEQEDAESREADVLAAAKRALAPELYNRLDEVLVFGPLGRPAVREVARRLLAKTARSLHAERGVELDVSDAAVEALLDLGGYDPLLGARPMRRTIAREIEARLSTLLLGGQLRRGDVALVEASRGKILVDVVRGQRRAGDAASA